MVYVALLCVPGRRHTEVGNFDTLCRSVRLFTTAYAVTRRLPAAAQPPATASVGAFQHELNPLSSQSLCIVAAIFLLCNYICIHIITVQPFWAYVRTSF